MSNLKQKNLKTSYLHFIKFKACHQLRSLEPKSFSMNSTENHRKSKICTSTIKPRTFDLPALRAYDPQQILYFFFCKKFIWKLTTDPLRRNQQVDWLASNDGRLII